MSQCAIPYTHNLKVINEAIYNGYATGVPNTIDEIVELMKISNEIINRFDVMHQSPQILLIKEGKCVYHDSHDGIEVNKLNKFIV